MDHKQAFGQNLPFSEQQARQVLSSPEGQRLMQILSADGGAVLQQAAQAMRAGDSARAQQILAPIMQSPQAQQLIDQLNRKKQQP